MCKSSIPAMTHQKWTLGKNGQSSGRKARKETVNKINTLIKSLYPSISFWRLGIILSLRSKNLLFSFVNLLSNLSPCRFAFWSLITSPAHASLCNRASCSLQETKYVQTYSVIIICALYYSYIVIAWNWLLYQWAVSSSSAQVTWVAQTWYLYLSFLRLWYWTWRSNSKLCIFVCKPTRKFYYQSQCRWIQTRDHLHASRQL